MDEELQRRVLHLRADRADLLQVQLARQHHLAEARVLQETGFFRGANVGLGAGVQLDGRHVDLQQAHVLDDERIRTGVV